MRALVVTVLALLGAAASAQGDDDARSKIILKPRAIETPERPDSKVLQQTGKTQKGAPSAENPRRGQDSTISIMNQ